MAEVSARDRKALVELVQAAQLVDAFGHFPKKQFMDRADDQARVAERVIEMRKRAGDLSPSFRKQHADLPWDDLEGLGRSPDELWRAAKKVTPRLLAGLEPLVAGMPESAFLVTEAERGTDRASTPKGRRSKEAAGDGRKARKDRPEPR
ncbi:MAG TPA: hypothetical protein VGA16_04875 [Candidatus Limnocylindria bacterium]